MTTFGGSALEVERLPLGAEQWLLDLGARRDEGPGHRVSELLPEGYETYLRLFHPFLSWDETPDGDTLNAGEQAPR